MKNWQNLKKFEKLVKKQWLSSAKLSKDKYELHFFLSLPILNNPHLSQTIPTHPKPSSLIPINPHIS